MTFLNFCVFCSFLLVFPWRFWKTDYFPIEDVPRKRLFFLFFQIKWVGFFRRCPWETLNQSGSFSRMGRNVPHFNPLHQYMYFKPKITKGIKIGKIFSAVINWPLNPQLMGRNSCQYKYTAFQARDMVVLAWFSAHRDGISC